MKKNAFTRGAAALLIAAMVGTLCGCAQTEKQEQAAPEAQPQSVTQTESGPLTATGDGLSKDETVYVLCGADGGVSKVIVSDWIQNGTKESAVTDPSKLQDVTVVKGDTSYTMNADGSKVWDAKGGDVYYQGTAEAPLPVSMTVTYLLDGKAVTTEELAGKSGKLTIRFDYQNNQYETVDIDGKQTRINVPFAMLTGMLLDNQVCQNVTVSNGKVINTGSNTAVLGFALPGLQENLALDADRLSLPDFIEITADVTNFSMGNTLTMATDQPFQEIDLSGSDSLKDLPDAMNRLNDAMAQLMDGSSQLYAGLNTLLEQSNTLVSAINQIAAGVQKLDESAQPVCDGAMSLRDNLKTLQGGLGQLAASSDTLNNGAKTVFETLLAQANQQIAAAGLQVDALTVDNYSAVLTKLLENLDDSAVQAMAEATAKKKVTAAVQASEGEINAKVTDAVKQKITAGVIAAVCQQSGITAEQYSQLVAAGGAQGAALQGAVEQNVAAKMASDEIKATIDQTVNEKENELISQNLNSVEVKAQIQAAVEQAKAGKTALASLKQQLDSYNQFYQGLQTYTSGVQTAYAGSAKLTEGAGSLYGYLQQISAGLTTLDDATKQLSQQTAALPDGVSQLANGAMQLSDGLKQLNEEGIQKLTDAMGGGTGDLLARLRATVDVAKDYQSYSGLSDGMSGSVKFVYRTDTIGQ